MRKILLVFALFTTVPATAVFAKGEKDKDVKEVVVKNATGAYSYEGVVAVENVSKEEMYKRSKQWVLSNLKTGDNNIGFDAEAQSINNTATIVMDPVGGFGWMITQGLFNFKIQLEFRDGRYKFIFDNIVVQSLYSTGIVETLAFEKITKNNKPAKHIKNEVNEKLAALAQSLEAAVKGAKSSNDNW